MKESREIIPTSAPERREIERPFDAPRPINDNGNYGMYRGAEPEEGLQIWDYWRAIRKRLWLVIGVAVLITTLTAIYMSRKPNIYESKATVQVDLEQANPDLVSKERSPLMTNNDPAYFIETRDNYFLR